ncbi:cytochrome c oxidase assembly protein [Microbacterium sp. YY-01]|uniref:cytochrome c oxidase assembly protein n=1 Tax=Microbacterium sp. YY-01 TaxID=3421634 RepID=UPI003D17A868
MTPRSSAVSYRVAGVVILLVAGLVATVVALWLGGGAAPLALGDAGPIVRWGLPAVKMVMNIAAAVMFGSLVLALFSLRSGERAFDVALDTASVGAAVFTVTGAASGFFTFMAAFNAKLSAGPEFGSQLGRFLVELPLGRAWLISVVLGAIVTIMAFAWRSWTPTLFTAIVAGASFLPLAEQGHSGDLEGHALAVDSLLLHTVGAAVWVGGLVLVVVLRGVLKPAGAAASGNPKRLHGRAKSPDAATSLGVVVERYSSLALVAFIVVAVSGVARSLVGMTRWEELFAPYGLIVIAKAVLLGLLGLFGAWYRMRLIPWIDKGRGGSFWTLILAELVLMGFASGAAAALARTPPPSGLQPAVDRTPAELLARRPLPPEFTIDRWFTEWYPGLIWMLATAFGIVFYLLAVRRLHQRGDSWPIHRTIVWIVGLLSFAWVTNGPLNAYEAFLFSTHMLAHMMLQMVIPILLVLGAPVTLALRALDKRDDGTRGAREWILWGIHSRYSKIITHPFVAAAVFIVSLWVFYFTDVIRWAMRDHYGHQWMVVHFLIAGYLFALTLIGVDPIPYRLPYPGRLLTLIGIMAMHAFFGIAIMMQSGLMVAEWYGSMGRTWGPTPLEDQYIGGGIAWSVGEIPTLILAVTAAIQWSRSDARAEKRRDRFADRTGDQELAAYNEQLAALAEKDRRLAETGRE